MSSLVVGPCLVGVDARVVVIAVGVTNVVVVCVAAAVDGDA